MPAEANATVAILKERIIHFADSLLQHQQNNAFHNVIGASPKDFVWGSNAVAANQGILLVNAFLIKKNTGNRLHRHQLFLCIE